jgi:outer membrane lipoprotein SlyB
MENTAFKKTHPLVLGAAASVVVVSLAGAAAITGLLPLAHSDKTDPPAPSSQAASGGVRHNGQKLAVHANACATCGTVESIHRVALKGDATGLGAVVGGVTGAAVGNQIGRGNGNTAMTILGAAGGALAGNEIEKNVKQRHAYRVTVRMDDGSVRTLSQSSPPTVEVGEHVRVVNGAVLARS